MSFELLPLINTLPGQTSHLAVHRFGPSNAEKVYIQAGLHADEHPGMLVAQRLIAKLIELDHANQLAAQFVVVPFANPIGLNQRIFGHVNGRCDLATGQNFNRGMAVDRTNIGSGVLAMLSDDLDNNDAVFRNWLQTQVTQGEALFGITNLHKTLLSLSIDAHYVLDLHCDYVALPHVFYGSHQHQDGQLLTQCMSAQVALEEDVTGIVAFDGTHTQPWVLAQNLSEQPLFKQPCFAATIELRGQADVNIELAEQDAEGILEFFAQKGLITGLTPNEQLNPVNKTIGVEQVKLVSAPAPGIVTYHCALGDTVSKGQLIAQVALLDQAIPTNVDIVAPNDGYVFSQTQHFYVSPGQTIAMLATEELQQAAGTQLAF
jgi:predicted deacylase